MLISLLAATAILVDAAPAAVKPTTAPPEAKKDELICHSEPVIGTNIKTKVCRTKAQLEADRAEQRQNLERMQTSGGRTPSLKGN